MLELREQIAKTSGQCVIDAMRSLDDPVRWILWPNGVGLQNHLSTFPFDATGRMLFDALDHDRMRDYLGVTLCLTHNLVAAVGTVIDHTRRTLRSNWPDRSNPVQLAFAQGSGRATWCKSGRAVGSLG
ncbi:MAG TPA: hypothetical protein VNI34_06270 [Candidatus Nitrosotalea sp.]|nr:hypothetical protein [Candidatus Nitrosotalea sp.]